jgi:hypothetical protein
MDHQELETTHWEKLITPAWGHTVVNWRCLGHFVLCLGKGCILSLQRETKWPGCLELGIGCWKKHRGCLPPHVDRRAECPGTVENNRDPKLHEQWAYHLGAGRNAQLFQLCTLWAFRFPWCIPEKLKSLMVRLSSHPAFCWNVWRNVWWKICLLWAQCVVTPGIRLIKQASAQDNKTTLEAESCISMMTKSADHQHLLLFLQGDHVTFFLSFSWTLCEEVVHLLVQDMFSAACVRSWTRIELLRKKSCGGRLNAWWKVAQKSRGGRLHLLDRRPICCHSIIRDSETRHEGCRDCDEGATKDQTWQVGMCTGTRALVTEGGDSRTSWTQLVVEVWEGSWKHELRREGVHIGVRSHSLWANC